MTIQESARIVHMIHTAYPADRKATAEELADRIDLWGVFFADYTAEEVARATKAWIFSSPFMPSPKDIKTACDVNRKLAGKISGAFFIPDDIQETDPETEARLDALWASITESEAEN